MKLSHLQTPRTLADCEFRTGYHSVSPSELRHRREDLFLLAICAVAAVLMLVGVI
jgi:hypothetical protein